MSVSKRLVASKDKRIKPYLRLCSMLILSLLLVSFCNIYNDYAENSENTVKQDLRILEKDWLTVIIVPAVWRLSSGCEPQYLGEPFDLNVYMNYNNRSIVEMRPRSQGLYNLTITIWSNTTTHCIIGVYTRNPDFYGNVYKGAGGYLNFTTLTFSRPGNYTINITLDSYGVPSSGFVIRLPTPANAMLFIAAAGTIAYINAFLVCDAYFKNKKEVASNRRWALCGIVIIISILAIYQLYNFTSLTSAFMEH